MKNLLRLEELSILFLSVFLFQYLHFAWWIYLLFFLAPDLGMLAYLFNTRLGAISYNVFHHKGLAVLLYLFGAYCSSEWLQFTGLILLGHASFDRILGYGLKYSDSFHHTHLGWIGKEKIV